jgi:hypothetical protein
LRRIAGRAIEALSVFKPQGLTPYGFRRRAAERAADPGGI